MPIDVYELEGEFHREALIGRLAGLAGNASFEHLQLVVDAFEGWAGQHEPAAPTLTLVVRIEDAAEESSG